MNDHKKKITEPEAEFEEVEHEEISFDNMKIGDDGLPMTKRRLRMHWCFNAYFIWGVVLVLCCLGLTMYSYFQGQEMTFFELIAYGGAEFKGYSVANLMRAEAVFCLVAGISCVAMSLYGFSWLYSEYTPKPIKRITTILGIACGLWICVSLFVGVVEPVALITLVFLFVQHRLMRGIVEEKPLLESLVTRQEEAKV